MLALVIGHPPGSGGNENTIQLVVGSSGSTTMETICIDTPHGTVALGVAAKHLSVATGFLGGIVAISVEGIVVLA